MFGIKRINLNIKYLQDSRTSFYERFQNLNKEIQKIHRLLFTTDRFGTVRPKIDMLIENIEKGNEKLNARLNVLEKKCLK